MLLTFLCVAALCRTTAGLRLVFLKRGLFLQRRPRASKVRCLGQGCDILIVTLKRTALEASAEAVALMVN